jgi:hypothetical protein
MSTIDTTNLEKLLTAKKFDEARAVLSEYLKGEFTEEEKASLHLSYAETYLRVMNSVQREYKKSLAKVVDILHTLDKEERSVAEAIGLRSVRQNLAA